MSLCCMKLGQKTQGMSNYNLRDLIIGMDTGLSHRCQSSVYILSTYLVV